MTALARTPTKICIGPCGRELDLSCFTRNANRPDLHETVCRECRPLRRLISMRLVEESELMAACEPDATPEMTFKEIGAVLGVSAQCVQQTEATALRKLRNNARILSAVRRLLEA